MRNLLLVSLACALGCSGGNNKVTLGADQDAGSDAALPSDAGTDMPQPMTDSGGSPDAGRDAAPEDLGVSPDMAEPQPDTGPGGVDCGPQTFTHQGIQRGYILCTPDPLPPGPLPVVLGFHGGGGNAATWWNGVAMHEVIVPAGFAMVYMQGCRDGLTDCTNPQGSFLWNVQKPGEPSAIDDESFTLEVIDRLSTAHALQVGALFAMGHSLGGMFTYTLRCDYPDLFAAIAPMSATPVDGTCTPTGDTSIYHVHGADDPNVPPLTGCCSGAQQNAGSPEYLAACDNMPRCFNPTNWWPRLRDGVHPFADLVGLEEIAADALGCANTQNVTPDYAQCRAVDGCRAGTAAEVCIVPGAEHGLGTIQPTFDYRAYVLSRFQRHR